MHVQSVTDRGTDIAGLSEPAEIIIVRRRNNKMSFNSAELRYIYDDLIKIEQGVKQVCRVIHTFDRIT